jgi:hypothetical protein
VEAEEKQKFFRELQAASPGKNDAFIREKYYKVSRELQSYIPF